ncbi:hypothetical protein KHQ06_27915 [Nocardia tengchongensis]|uniref:Resolvase/invertase-type recombinase catalytic domain-containing protein n=2 Tax=Nocardia tengchongensis TaxID=2055889 RepID=A0ABX8CJC3_9NOCA|nr:hypothetical protein KHQ06_27915 [Nocardia tengchongensis]
MNPMPSAVGFLRSDVSGLSHVRDELRIRDAAKRTGYDLRKIVVFNDRTEDRQHRLRVVVDRLRVDAVIVPSIKHFDDHAIPVELLTMAAVITVSPGSTTPRTRSTTA